MRVGLLGDLVVRIVGDTQDFVRKVDQSGRKMKQFDRDMQRIGRNMVRTGKALTMAITLPILGIAVAAIKVAGDFEKSMNRVRAVTGATADEMRELEEVARSLGETTQFSAAQAADGMTFLAMAGFDANKIIGAMPAVLNLAAAAQIDMAEAADIASNILSGFNLEADELSGAIDIMAKTFTSSNTDLVQLGEAMSLVAPVANAFGVSMEETAAAIGILSNAGIQASRAGTGLRRTLTVLISEADRLGIVTQDSAGKMRPLADILDDLTEAGLSAEDAMEIFGQRAGPAITVLLAQGGDALRDFTEELENAGGTAREIAEIQMEGLFGAMKRFRSTAEEAGITIGNILLPKIMDLLEGIRGLFERFNALDESTQRMILQYAGIAAAIGPLLIVFGSIILLVGRLKAAMVLLNITMAANPAIIMAAAIAALATVMVLVLPIMVRAIRRHREYERQIGLTREALEELTEVERQRERTGLVEAREREAEAIRDLTNKVQGLKVITNEYGMAMNDISVEQKTLNDLRDRAIERFDLLQEKIVDIDQLTVKYNQSIVAEQEAFDETTLSVEDFQAALAELTDEIDDNTESVIEHTDKWRRWQELMKKGGSDDPFKVISEGSETAVSALITLGVSFGNVFIAQNLWFDSIVENGEALGDLGVVITDFADLTDHAFEEEQRRAAWREAFAEQVAADARAALEAEQLQAVQAAIVAQGVIDALAVQAAAEEEAREEAIAGENAKWFAFVGRARTSQAEINAINEAAAEAEKQRLDDLFEHYTRYVNAIVDSTQRMVTALASIGTARAAADMQDIDETLAARIAADLAIIASSDSTAEAQKAARERVTAAEDDAAAATRVIQREQAQRAKRLGIFNIAIDTVQAAFRAFKDYPFPLSAVIAALVGAAGLAAGVAIAAQPLPALAAGGIVTGPTPAMVGEGGQPEIIFPLDQLGDFLSRRGDFDDMGGGVTSVVVNLDGAQILEYIGKATDDKRLLINQAAVV